MKLKTIKEVLDWMKENDIIGELQAKLLYLDSKRELTRGDDGISKR